MLSTLKFPVVYFAHLFRLFALLIFLLALNVLGFSQERIVDDAAITKYRSFQIETWLAQYESVFMPAVGVNHWLELGAGLSFDTQDNLSFSGLILETKFINADYETTGQSIGLVIGHVLDDMLNYDELYIYAPYSRLILNATSVMHLNAGMAYHGYNHEQAEKSVHFLYGIRGDFGVLPRFDLLGGIFGENLDPGFYAGFRYHLLPDLLEIIVTYGRGFRPDDRFPGLSFQLSLIPDQLW